MDKSGLGLLPGIVGALGLVIFPMALLLFDSMWAGFGVLALAIAVTVAILVVVVALLDEGERGGRLRRAIPGLDETRTRAETRTRCFAFTGYAGQYKKGPSGAAKPATSRLA